MDFSPTQRDPRRHLAGIVAVVAFHALIVYALVSGLATKVVDVVRAPIETRVIEEVKKPPPPPAVVVVPPPPRREAPPPPFIPPPEIQIAAPPPPQPTITAAPTPPPPAPLAVAPMAPPVVAEAAPAPPKPAGTDVRAYCSGMPKPEVPGTSFAGKLSMTARATIQGNKIVQAEIVPGTFRGTADRKVQRLFAAAVSEAMLSYTCSGDNVVVEQQFAFTIE